jgi:antirestriction protein ArdC
MAHPAPPARTPGARANLYTNITDRIIAELEEGRVPWVQPWDSVGCGVGMPRNAATGRTYSGINILTLWHAAMSRGFKSHAFLTYAQAQNLGASVRRGEKGTGVVYAHRFVPASEKRAAVAEQRDIKRGIPFLKQFTVFCVDQCDGLPDHMLEPLPPVSQQLIMQRANRLIKATRADFRIGGGMAFYSPQYDFVQVPRPDDFHEPINWHRTAFHELGHWTGHGSRLDRDQKGSFGSSSYGREELIAEMAGAFLCASLGIEPTVRHADYLGSWLAIIREDNRAIIRAASAASKAADYLLAFLNGDPANENEAQVGYSEEMAA